MSKNFYSITAKKLQFNTCLKMNKKSKVKDRTVHTLRIILVCRKYIRKSRKKVFLSQSINQYRKCLHRDVASTVQI